MSERISTIDNPNSEPQANEVFTFTLEELQDLGVDINRLRRRTEAVDKWSGHDNRLTEVADNLDSEALETSDDLVAAQEEPFMSWPDENSPGSVLTQRCIFWAGNIGHGLDCCRDLIENEVQAQQWLDLKKAVAHCKTIGNPYEVAKNYDLLEAAAHDFVLNSGITVTSETINEYNKVCNR